MAQLNKAGKVLQRHGKLKEIKAPWIPLYQDIGEYVMTRKQSFTQVATAGRFINREIFDGTAGSANHLMASTLIGSLWPNGAKTFRIDPPRGLKKQDAESKEVKDYFEEVTRVMVAAMDEPTAGLITSLEEYMLDQGTFGISGIAIFENDDEELPVRFTAVDAKKIVIAEGKDGFINTVYIEKQVSLLQLVEEFGVENISEKSRAAYNSGSGRLEDKVTILHAIEPRIEGKVPGSFGNRSMPVASIHIEVDAKHVLKESGYMEMPVLITRFWKAMGEIYGRSPAMETLSNILEINHLREAVIIATEKMLDPPLAVTHDAAAGNCVIDTSSGAINVRSQSGRIEAHGGKWIEPIITVGEMQSTYKRIEDLKSIIESDFFIDRLLDLNNETRMTLGEAQIRNELRGQSLGTIYARQISELFTRMVQRVFNILYKKRLLGVIRDSAEHNDELDKGNEPTFFVPESVAALMTAYKDAYKVTFISPAARIMRAEELLGIQRSLTFAVEIQPVAPDIMDNFDTDCIARDVADLTGAPSRSMRSYEEVKKIRAQRSEQQAQAAQLEAQRQQSEAARNMGQAAAGAGQAGIL